VKTVHTTYRFARPDDNLAADRTAEIRFGPDPAEVTVIVRPGHTTIELLDDFSRQQEAMFTTGQWAGLDPTPENLRHPRRVLDASWQLAPGHLMPNGVILMSLENPGRHVWMIREGYATEELVRDMTALLTDMVRSGVWIQRGAGSADPNAD
jgi:hypothetical protein